MDGAKKKIALLIEQGRTFTYANFSTKTHNGYPEAFSADWISWRARVSGAINGLFSRESAPVQMLERSAHVRVLGNGHDKFDLVMSYYMGALDAAKETLEEDTFGEISKERATGPLEYSNKVFVVHGRDDVAKSELELFLKEVGLDPIVLHRQVDGGKTVIEKFEKYADVGYAFILLTPDEVAYLVGEEGKADADREKELRARPNVIFEFGYFVGKLGRSRICCLHKGNVVVPSDINGVVYKRFNNAIDEVAWSLVKELKGAGYKLKDL